MPALPFWRPVASVVLLLVCLPSFAATVNDFPKATIAVVGGTFMNDALLKRQDLIKGSFKLKTKVGESPTIYACESAGIPFYYIHGHGEGRWVETWAALYDLGVRDAIGGATAGGINRSMKLYDYVVPHDFIDMNVDRSLSMPLVVYRDPNAIPLPRFVPAMDPLLRQILIEETRKALRASHNYDDIQLHDQGVLIQARGGRFETAAEIRMFATWGADLVTMNVATEMAYARMMGINYATLIAISNPAEGVGEWDWETLKDVYPRLNPLSLSIVLAALPRIAAIADDVPRVGDGLRMHPENDQRAERIPLMRDATRDEDEAIERSPTPTLPRIAEEGDEHGSAFSAFGFLPPAARGGNFSFPPPVAGGGQGGGLFFQ